MSFDFCWILEKKRAEINNSRQFRGLTLRRRGPLAAAKVHATAWHVHTATWIRRGFFSSLGSSRRS